MPIQSLCFAPQRFQRRLRGGQFRLTAAQIPLQPRGIAACAFSAPQRFGHLPFHGAGAVRGTARCQFQIRKPRAQPIAFPAQPIAFAGKPIAFFAEQRQGLHGRVTRCCGAAQIITEATQLLAQLFPLCGFQRQQFRQFSNTEIELIHRLFA